ncbi:MAG: DUF1080 domain-containing protein [Cytophagales bacterium]|nr:MAG: DUF1080 domain-containing protein [Cytophagales bacterium]
MKTQIFVVLLSLQFVVLGQNKLTKSEEKQGFKLLFDGKNLDNWRNFQSKSLNSAWKVENESITLTQAGGGEIVSLEKYENFELILEWKISDCGNSGIFYHVSEDSIFKNAYETGPEMQILDNKCHPDNKMITHQAGALYDMKAVSLNSVKKAGEWNIVKIIVNKNKVEHWLNGKKVVQYSLFDTNWDKMVKNSKFYDWKGFGKYKSGHIALQDHGDKVSFRNIKIRKL